MSGVNNQDQLKRRQFSRRLRILLIVVGLFCLWQILISPTVWDAILDFCFGGVVQGTDIVLSPNTMLMGVAAIFGLGALWFLSKFLWRYFELRNYYAKQPQSWEPAKISFTAPTPVVEVPMVATVATKAVVAERPKRQKTKLTLPKLPKVQMPAVDLSTPTNWLQRFVVNSVFVGAQVFAVVRRTTVKWSIITARWLNRTSRVVAHWTVEAFLWALIILTEGYKRLEQAEIWFGKFVARQSAAFWVWFAPYAWQFDAWLEKRVHQFGHWLNRTMHRSDRLTVVLDIGRQYTRFINVHLRSKR